MSQSTTPATHSQGRCHQAPRLPRKVKADVSKRHACHTAAATTASNRTQARHKCQPSATSATPATQSESLCPMPSSAMLATQSEGLCRQAPSLPCKVKADVTKRHACHTKSHGDNGVKRDRSAPPEPAQCQCV